jgi:hypothetical protein
MHHQGAGKSLCCEASAAAGRNRNGKNHSAPLRPVSANDSDFRELHIKHYFYINN